MSAVSEPPEGIWGDNGKYPTFAEWRESVTVDALPADQCPACGQQRDEHGGCRRCTRKQRGDRR